MEKDKLNIENKKPITILIIIVVIIGGYFLFQGNNPVTNTVKVTFPYTLNVVSNTSFACESLVSADIIGSPEEYLTNGIEGSVQKGTDKIAMNIKDEKTLNFLTGGDMQAGASEGENFTIVQNNNQKLMAIWFNENVISTVVLNKTNGLGVWLKGNPDFITYGAPFGNIIYMICR
ncbi:MAG: hypothetical protein NUV64_01920 [Parcubacteria group bacterium]|nr:hypothetical protein [Parcubacteria group bacterium]MCR4342771.1 hypothetical protein [Patescibacteria group bacterium]